MKKFWRKAHLWLSVPLGIFIVLISFSGAMLVFEKELTDASCPAAGNAGRASGALPLDSVMRKVASLLPDSAEIANVEIPPQNLSAYNGGEAYRVALKGRGRKTLFVDPRSGDVIGQTQRTPFFRAMHSLHGSLLLKRGSDGRIAWGSLIVGVSTLLFLLALITGAVVWWPRSREALRRGLTITGKHGSHRLLFSLHDAGGIYAFLFLAAMCVTGLTWSFPWFSKGFYALLGASESKEVKTHDAPSKEAAEELPVDYKAWEHAYAQVVRENPGRRIKVSDGKIDINLGDYGNPRAADTYRFDRADGSITGVDRYADAPRRRKISGWVGAFHTGSWGGWVSKTLYFLAALIGATLPLTGYYLWVKRLCRRRV